MAFYPRNVGEIYPNIEVSITAALSPGVVANNTTVQVSAACTVGGAAAGPSNATFALGDNLEVIAPAAAALNGIVVTASPSATPGTCVVSFQNNTGAGITPVASTKYTILAKRFPPTFF